MTYAVSSRVTRTEGGVTGRSSRVSVSSRMRPTSAGTRSARSDVVTTAATSASASW